MQPSIKSDKVLTNFLTSITSRIEFYIFKRRKTNMLSRGENSAIKRKIQQ